ncbi:hypothetical protein ACLIYP_05580 [Streptomyces nanhaiensis]|uniref:hypothetical protein n=1 Tax=Streptomyces nanhaiensis TaxID=679319 RepID=UPI00399D4057
MSSYEFVSQQYPQLQVIGPAGRARFDGGRFATDDTALGEALRSLPGIECVSAPAPGGGDPLERPAKSATKGDWVAYAVASGADRETAEAATKDELIERYGGEG